MMWYLQEWENRSDSPRSPCLPHYPKPNVTCVYLLRSWKKTVAVYDDQDDWRAKECGFVVLAQSCHMKRANSRGWGWVSVPASACRQAESGRVAVCF